MRRLKKFWKQETGTVLVEILVVTPILVATAAFVIEVSSLFQRQQEIVTALRAGAQYLAFCEISSGGCNDSQVDGIIRLGMTGDAGAVTGNMLTVSSITIDRTTNEVSGLRIGTLTVNYVFTGGGIFASGLGLVDGVTGSRSLSTRLMP